ncbi:MAG: hypothetical protein Q7T44_12780 [Parvibaculum sp.]|nr:hypothetical protein [Parvibaculum sp.]
MRFISILAAGSLLMATSAYAASPQPEKEIAAAATHAGLAAESPDINQVHMHLHHALNCLVGPNGEGYSAKDMDPCSALGNGLLADATGKNQMIGVNAAIVSAKAGLAATDLEKAKAEAAATKATLDTIK